MASKHQSAKLLVKEMKTVMPQLTRMKLQRLALPIVSNNGEQMECSSFAHGKVRRFNHFREQFGT